MIINYLKLAARNINKNRFYTSINVICLTLGLTASILATMFIVDERSFDAFHAKSDRLFRLNKVNFESGGQTSLTGESSGLMGPTMVSEFPEVENCVRFMPWFNPVMLSYNERNVMLQSQEMIFVDSSFFQVFDFRLLKGDEGNALRKPGSIVVTQELAQALFGADDPIGKTVVGLQNQQFEITGIIENAPRNSHIQYRALCSWTTTVPQLGSIPMEFMNNWISQALTTYVLLRNGSDEAKVEAKLGKFMSDHIPTRVERYSLYLQPFRDVYLHSYNIQGTKMQKTGSYQFNKFFILIAGFILFVACVNYINISTSRATRRGREVAMRKTLGAKRKQLIVQFLGESFLMVMIAGFLAVVLLIVAVPYFNELTGKTLALNVLYDRYVIAGIAIVILVVTLASGLYPSLVLSQFSPALIQGARKLRLTGNLPRQVLIVFQFIVTISMITGTLFVYQQIKLVLTADMGFDKEHVLVVNMTSEMMQKRQVLVNEVNALPNVISSSTSQTAIGKGTYSTYVIPEGFNPDEIETRVFAVDGNYLKTYGLSMAMGRFFDPSSTTDSSAVIINEAMIKKLSWTDPLSKTIKFSEDAPAYPVIGVIKDFRFKSFYEAVEPLVMFISPSNQRNLAVRFSGSPSNVISTLETQWKKIEQRYPFEYFFVDEQFAKAYEAEEKLLRTVLTFAGLSIVIACLGLYGLVSFTIEQRTKEFGIRKVLGASVASLNYLVNKKFLALVVIGGAVSVPLVMYFINDWLKKFTLQISVSPIVFGVSVGITVVVTIIAVSIQAMRAAMANPVDSLRHE
jgi:putative ABC transport system permease protein